MTESAKSKPVVLSFGEWLSRNMPAIVNAMPAAALPGDGRVHGFPFALHETAHRLYFAYKTMIESEQANGWHDDFTRMDYDLRVMTGDTGGDSWPGLMQRYDPDGYERQEQEKRAREKAKRDAAKARDLAQRSEQWDRAAPVP